MTDRRQTLPSLGESSSATIPLRVLITAQPFGFGPTAAMAQVFDFLRPRVQYLAFAGVGHACDLHMQLPYDAVHRLPVDDRGEAFRLLCAEHDAALVSCDFPAAEAAKAAGMPVCVYDPLAWYWPQWPSVLESAELYICQDFFGVRERVHEAGHKNIAIVPPILPTTSQVAARRNHRALVNLGGLRNPFHSKEVSLSYTRLVMTIAPVAARLYPEVHVATSQSLVDDLQHESPWVRTSSPREAQHLLNTSELAVMTPGLGNIYEAAALAKRVLWLPPSNATQGLQLNMLRQRGLAPFAADWHDILPARAPIDYGGHEPDVGWDIADAIHDALQDPAAAERLQALFLQAERAPETPNPLTALLELFGAGGDRHVAELFMQRVLVPLARTTGKRPSPGSHVPAPPVAASHRTGRSFVAPRDVFELRLSQLWTGVLRKDRIGVKDDLLALGGDHAMAETILGATAAQFDAALSVEAFLENPTIERLACLLRKRSERLNTQPLVKLQPNGSKRPLFFLPGGDGNVFNFHDLARRMAPDQPLYGLQTRGLYGEQAPYDRVEDMAADHIETMRAVQPHGPYLLGGHCFGAIVALEMALQLQRQGERVALLAAIDALAPAAFSSKGDAPVADPVDFYEFIAYGFRSWFNTNLRLKREALLDLPPERRAAHFMDLARQAAIYAPDAADDRIGHVLELFRRINRLKYAPGDVATAPITFFRGCDAGSYCEGVTTGGWEEVSLQPLRVRDVPGNHVTLVTEPNVELLAYELRAAIAQAQVS